MGVVVVGVTDAHRKSCPISPITCRCGGKHTTWPHLSPQEIRRRTELLLLAETQDAGTAAIAGRPDLTLEEVQRARFNRERYQT